MSERPDLHVVVDGGRGGAGDALSLDIPEDIGREVWLELGRELHRRREVSQWALGDWACHGDRRYGDLAEAAAEIGIGYGNLRNLASVSRKIELSRRRDTLSWSHHAAVASLAPEVGDGLLDRAEAEGWSREVIREEAKAVSVEGQLRAENERLRRELERARSDARAARDVTMRFERRLRSSAKQLPQAYREFTRIAAETAKAPELERLHGNARNALAVRFQTIIDQAAGSCEAIARDELSRALEALKAPGADVA